MTVYNRWGSVVWRTDTPGAQWLGNNAAGIFDYTPSTEKYYVPDGMYYWTLRGQKRGDVWYDMSGTITLLR